METEFLTSKLIRIRGLILQKFYKRNFIQTGIWEKIQKVPIFPA